MEQQNQETTESKVCTKCQQDKSLDDYGKSTQGRFGRKSWCKECEAVRAHKYWLKKKATKNAKAVVAKEKAGIAPGSQVVKNILAKAGYDGDLKKAVDLLIAQGFLAEELLQAARVMVRYESVGGVK